MNKVEDRKRLFRELVTSVHDLYFTEFDENFKPIYSNSVHPNVIFVFLTLDEGFTDLVIDNKRSSARDMFYQGKPAFHTNSIGMSWISDIEMEEGKVKKIHVMGPVFLDDISLKQIEKAIRKLDVTPSLKIQLMQIIKEIPIIPHMRFCEYGIMFHKCLTGERTTVSEYIFPSQEKASHIQEDEKDMIKKGHSGHGTYMMEQQLLKFVEEGNIHYQKEKDRLIHYGAVGKISNKNYLRQTKNLVITFTALCCRAAIRGGVSPDIAYFLSDNYIQSIEGCETLAEVNEISNTMYDDYIQRVYKLKISKGISSQIQKSCDHISLHLNEKLDIKKLAKKVGYTDYYFTKKFKEETGFNIKDYVMNKKIERAKDLLKQHNKSILDISEELGFNSQSYFGHVFKSHTGMSPGEYRKEDW